jgi:hypothetical protein
MNKRKGFADQVAKKAKVNLQPVPTEDQETLEPSQEKTVHIGGHFSKDVHTQLKLIAVEKDMKLREVLADAFNMYLRSNNKPPIA